MEPGAGELAVAIGARVRRERQGRGWTLDQLAEAAGVSRRMVVNVEQGSSNPSVGTLLRLAEALGVGLPALVEPPAETAVTVVRDGRGATLWTGAQGGRGVLVASVAQPDVVELWDWTLGPGDRHESRPHTAGTRELVHVLSGTVTLEAGGQVVVLEAGDAAAFAGDAPHAYRADGSDGARFSLAVHEPGGSAVVPGGRRG